MRQWISSIYRPVVMIAPMMRATQVSIRRLILLTLLTLLMTGCQGQRALIAPKIAPPPPTAHGNSLLGFPDFTQEESRESWSREAYIARSFAEEMDLYRAITGYKRALFLLPPKHQQRKQEIEYAIILCYYLGGKYHDVVETFERSSLIELPSSLSAREDLLVILHDSYLKIDACEKAEQIAEQMANPCLIEKVNLSQALQTGDLQTLHCLQNHYPPLSLMMTTYHSQAKSVQQAQVLNALLPGAGYYYVGLKQTALTSFIINGLFGAAAYYCFDQGNIPAGLIITSLECGWYFGGIKGAGIAAKEYNERLYEGLARDLLCKEQLFPIFMITHTF